MSNLLTDDHSQIDSILKKLFAAIDNGDFEGVYQNLDFFWARLAMHIRAEHLHLFPALIRTFETSRITEKSGLSLEIAKSKIAQLKSDHDFFMRELAALIKQIRDLQTIEQTKTSTLLLSVREKISTVYRRLEIHNKLEEFEVYRWADALLDSEKRAELNERMRGELENLPPRFDKSKGGALNEDL